MKLFHHLLQLSCYVKTLAFERAAKKNCHHLHKIDSPTTYDDYKVKFESAMGELDGEKIIRKEPTSGSSGHVKWIPYTKSFLKELDNTIAPWLFDLYRTYPNIKNGVHYWSLSWLPKELQTIKNSDDKELLNPLRKMFLNKIMLDSNDIQKAKTQEGAHFYLVCKLLSCKELSLISIWSPTFLLVLTKKIIEKDTSLIKSLKQGDWQDFSSDLSEVKFPISKERALELLNIFETNNSMKNIWPRLALISCWDSSYSKNFAKILAEQFPNVPIQGKGLWATEGVVSFPYRNQKVLAIKSHLIEFLDVDNNQIYSYDKVKKNKIYQPLISNALGLKRYNLLDNVRVEGFYHKLPILEFLGRDKMIDIVGEKISYDNAEKVIQYLSNKYNADLYTIGVKACENQVYYYLVAQNLSEKAQNEIAIELEDELLKYYHYRVARELGQLGEAKCLNVESAMEYYLDKRSSQVDISGNIKIEPLFLDRT